MKIIIRCEKCGKVLKGNAEKAQIFGKCPCCGENLVIQDPVSQENRKHKRMFIGESKFVMPIPETLTQCKESPACRVIYTEAPPVEFALKRSTHVPLLDLSEGGMGLLIRADEASEGFLPGSVFIAEVDFPILVQSIFIQVEVCWIRAMKEEKLLHVGVRFCKSEEAFKGVIKNLIEYITARTEKLDFDKWGAFG